MSPYSVRFLTHGNRVYSVQNIAAETDQEVIAAALKGYYGVQIGRGYEIWSGDRLVHFHPFPNMK